MTLCTTLNRIRAHGPCEDGWRKLLAGLEKTEADDEPLPYARIVEINGIEDALWATRAEPGYAKEWHVVAAVQIAERYAHGMASESQLDAAEAAASSAASGAASAAWSAQEKCFLEIVS